MSIRTTGTLDEGRVTFRERESKVQVSDPVCGMDVDPSSPETKRSERSGAVYYFCSDACREKFDSDPEDFINGG